MSNIVLWSGGYDSTLMLHNLLSGGYRDVIAVSVKYHPQLSNELLAMERRARNNYAEYAKINNMEFDQAEILIDNTSTITVSPGGIVQPSIWLMISMLYVNDGDTLHFGYIRSDDFWHHKQQFVTMFESICGLRNLENVKLRFNLEWYTKWDVIAEFEKLGVPSDCAWYCESPKSDFPHTPCGACNCCRTHRVAQMWLDEKERGSLATISKLTCDDIELVGS